MARGRKHELWAYMRVYTPGEGWSTWEYHSKELIVQTVAFVVPRGGVVQIQRRPGDPKVVQYARARRSA